MTCSVVFSLPKHPLTLMFDEYQTSAYDSLHALLIKYKTSQEQYDADALTSWRTNGGPCSVSGGGSASWSASAKSVNFSLDSGATIIATDDEAVVRRKAASKADATGDAKAGDSKAGDAKSGDAQPGALEESTFEYDEPEDSALLKSLRVIHGTTLGEPKSHAAPETASSDSANDSATAASMPHEVAADAATVSELEASADFSAHGAGAADFGLSVASAVSAFSYDVTLQARRSLHVANIVPQQEFQQLLVSSNSCS